MAEAGTFFGEVERGWRRLLRLSWRGKAVAVLILLGVPAVFVVCNFVVLPRLTTRATTHVSYQQLLDGDPSPTLEVWVEDNTIEFRLLQVRETTDGAGKRVAVVIDVRSGSHDTHELFCRLAYVDAGKAYSADATRFMVGGTPVNDVDISPGTLAVEAEFLVPETARPTSLQLRLHFRGLVPVFPGSQYEAEFEFDP